VQKINVIARKDDLDPQRAPGKVAIVLDIIFATSTIVTALQQGARSVVPALDEAQARQLAGVREPEGFVLAGEYHADTLSGFHAYNPLAMRASLLAGKDLIYSTTNGTVALCKAQACRHVYIGALLNARAVVDHLLRHFQTETILLVCAGSRGTFSLEDFFAAGYFVSLLFELGGKSRIALSDSAIAAMRLARQNDPLDILLSSKVGLRMLDRGMQADIEHSAALDTGSIIPVLTNGIVVRA